jgi:hypothetical protein
MVSASIDCTRQAWEVYLHDEFDVEFEQLDREVRVGLIGAMRAVEHAGPHTGRPHADVLHGSKFANMKELRFTARAGREIWRAAFAFDPDRRACVLVAGAKQGRSQAAFYKQLIQVADRRFAELLARAVDGLTKLQRS